MSPLMPNHHSSEEHLQGRDGDDCRRGTPAVDSLRSSARAVPLSSAVDSNDDDDHREEDQHSAVFTHSNYEFSDIPDEILYVCFSYMQNSELAITLGRVCKRWSLIWPNCVTSFKASQKYNAMEIPQLEQHLARFPNLEHINLEEYNRTNDRIVLFVAQKFHAKLRHLNISKSRVTLAGLKGLQCCSALEQLIMRSCSKLRDDFVQWVRTTAQAADFPPRLALLDISDNPAYINFDVLLSLLAIDGLTKNICAAHLIEFNNANNNNNNNGNGNNRRGGHQLHFDIDGFKERIAQVRTLSPASVQHLCDGALISNHRLVMEIFATELNMFPSIDAISSIMRSGGLGLFTRLKYINYLQSNDINDETTGIPVKVVAECVERGHDHVLLNLRFAKYARFNEIPVLSVSRALARGFNNCLDQLIGCGYNKFHEVPVSFVEEAVRNGFGGAINRLRLAGYSKFDQIHTSALVASCAKGHHNVLSQLRLCNLNPDKVREIPIEVVIDVIRAGHSGVLSQLRLLGYDKFDLIPEDALLQAAKNGHWNIAQQVRLALSDIKKTAAAAAAAATSDSDTVAAASSSPRAANGGGAKFNKFRSSKAKRVSKMLK